MEQLTEFNKILDDLENIEVHLEDEDKTILLLCALPRFLNLSRIPCSMAKKTLSPWKKFKRL